MTRFLRLSLGLAALGVGLGVLLRLGHAFSIPWLPVAKATHAHSHTLFFGWAGLALATLLFERVGATGRGPRAALWGLAAVSLATFVVFLGWGYARPGVVVSALSLAPWLAVVAVFLSAARRQRGADLPYLRAGMLYVPVAFACALTRVALLARRGGDPLWPDLLVHGFLGAFTAFFALAVMGLTVRHLGARPPRVVVGVLVPLALWPAGLVVPGALASFLGPVLRAATLVLLVPALAWLAWIWRTTASRPTGLKWNLRLPALAWAFKSALEALVALGLLGPLVTQRHAVVLHVHLVLLSFVTSSVLLFLHLRSPAPSLRGLLAHQGAVGLMLAGLGLAALAAFLGTEVARLGLLLAAGGGLATTVVQMVLGAEFFRSSTAPRGGSGHAGFAGND